MALLFSLSAWAQPTGLPSFPEQIWLKGGTKKDTTNAMMFTAGYFFFSAGKAFQGSGKYHAALPYHQYERSGGWLGMERPLYRKWSWKIVIPWFYSSVKRPGTGNKTMTYYQKGVSEIGLHLNYRYQSLRWKLYAGIQSGIPLQEGRLSFTHPSAPIGNDGYWNTGIEGGIHWRVNEDFDGFLNASFLYRIARSGALFEGDTAMILTDGKYASVQATLEPGWQAFAGAGWVMHTPVADWIWGYEFFYEARDRASGILPFSTPVIESAIQRAMQGPAHTHNFLAGISHPTGPWNFGLVFRAAFRGESALSGKTLIFIIRFTLP